MKNNEIKKILMQALNLSTVYVSNDGGHFYVVAVSEKFAGMSQLQKQQMIYAPLTEYISNHCIHSLSIKAFTPEEWRYSYHNSE